MTNLIFTIFLICYSSLSYAIGSKTVFKSDGLAGLYVEENAITDENGNLLADKDGNALVNSVDTGIKSDTDGCYSSYNSTAYATYFCIIGTNEKVINFKNIKLIQLESGYPRTISGCAKPRLITKSIDSDNQLIVKMIVDKDRFFVLTFYKEKNYKDGRVDYFHPSIVYKNGGTHSRLLQSSRSIDLKQIIASAKDDPSCIFN